MSGTPTPAEESTEPEENESVQEPEEVQTEEPEEESQDNETAFAALVRANEVSTLLERHGKFSEESVIYEASGDTDAIHTYIDGTQAADAYAYLFEGMFGMFLTDGQYFEYSPQDETVGEVLFANDAAYQEFFDLQASGHDLSIDDSEAMTEFTRQDGQIIVTTETDDAELLEIESIYGIAFEYQDGMSMTYVYTFDEATGAMMNLTSILHNGEESRTVMESSFKYGDDVESYDFTASPIADALTAETRTFTLTFYPGTDNEVTNTYQVAKGCPAGVWFEGNYGEFYSNPELTEAYELTDETYSEDVTAYVGAAAEG